MRVPLMISRFFLFCFALIAGSPALFGQLAGTNPLARFHTDLLDMDVLLLQDVAPNTVANFLGYVNPGAYDNSFIHRSPLHFVIQGGGFKFVNNQMVGITQHAAVVNEFHVSNTRGTLAMAKLGGNPNSATNQWFFNEMDSNASGPNGLDTQNGGFTVFGRIINASGLTTMDTIAAVPRFDATAVYGPSFDALPLQNYDTVNNPPLADANLVHVIWIKVVPQIVALTHPSANTIHIQGRGVASTTYKLQSSSSPNASSFTNLANATTGSQGNFNNDDTSPGTRKFYRLTIP
jgi:peptidyl-prolyl cis-trans isomerase A (cyclophilin A)